MLKLKLGLAVLFCQLFVMLVSNYFMMPVIGSSDGFWVGNDTAGKSLEEWAIDYWNWSISIPVDIHKDLATKLDTCIMGPADRSEPIVFLFDAYNETYSAMCSISSDQSILVPLLIGECDPTVPGMNQNPTIEELWNCAGTADDETMTAWDVSLDNQTLFKKSSSELVNLDLKDKISVTNSSLFFLDMPANNRYSSPEGTYPAVVQGYYLILNPLTPGEHMLKYSYVSTSNSSGTVQNIPSSASYSFTVM